MTLQKINEWLEDAITRANEDVEDNICARNSYGAGYDKGYRDAFKTVQSFINGDEDA